VGGPASGATTGSGRRLMPDSQHTEIARIALSVAEQHGFALGGGLALVLHGIVDRPRLRRTASCRRSVVGSRA
jgi:hypothetical protein